MKIHVEKLGAIRQADFTLNDMTIICGANNTGKTYVTHGTFGFFDFLRVASEFPVERSLIDGLLNEGSATLSLEKYVKNIQKHIDKMSVEYTGILYQIFAGKEKQFKSAAFRLDFITGKLIQLNDVRVTFGSAERKVLQISSTKDKKSLQLSLIIDKAADDIPRRHIIEEMISNSIRMAIIERTIPRPFLASAERTGAAIFQRELDFTKNRLVELLGDKNTKLHPLQFLSKFSGNYPVAVRKNVDFIRSLPDVANKESFISKDHPEILASFADIIGGQYKVNKDGEVQFVPAANKNIKLSLVESSSAVRSLLDVGFYLRHIAKPGDLLMIDEPELNLHPENQRRVARLFARLINLGIKVFVTTHSDYIIKELNTLIMLNQKGERFAKLAKTNKYDASELLDPQKVHVYIAEKALVKLNGSQRKSRVSTLVQADIDAQFGIEARSFDATIEDMNRIQEEIVWGQ